MNLIFKILWKLIVDRKKEYLDSQFNTLQQNTDNKERQLKKLQMSVHKHIGLEVKNTVHLAKESVLSLSKEIIPEAVKEALNDMRQIQQTPANDMLFPSVAGVFFFFQN